MEDGHQPQHIPGRRNLLAAMAGGLGVVASAAIGQNAAATSTSAAKRLPLTVQATEGPYYFDAKKVRADITEGFRGVPLEVRFTVVDQAGKPLSRARVDIWHCNAEGLYSGYDGQGDAGTVSMKERTFLRGTQPTGADGVTAFKSIYPGWYQGRTTHIHFKVFTGQREVLTSQFFLPDALSEFLYANLPDYKRSGVRDTLNSTDGIALMAGETVMGSVREEKDRYVASLTLVVDPNAAAASGRTAEPAPGDRPMGGPPPGAGPGGRIALAGDARISALVPRAR